MPKKEPTDYALQFLLDLDGITYGLDSGHAVKYAFRKISPTPARPHGVDYSLVLLDENNQRVLGYDNGDLPPKPRARYAPKPTAWDHRHQRGVIKPYDFESWERLLEDFWNDAEEFTKRGN